MLFSRTRHLHTTSTSNARMRNIAISSYLIRGIHDHHTFIGFVREDASYFAQQGGFSHTWATKNQDGLALFDNITDQGNTAKHRSPNTACQANDFPFAVTHCTDTVQSAFNACAVVVAKLADTFDHIFEVGVGYGLGAKDHLSLGEAALGITPEVQYDLQQFGSVL